MPRKDCVSDTSVSQETEAAMMVESETLGVVPGVAVGVHTARHSQMKACRPFSEPL